jgi:gas vesicle protein GvpL/GvpF
MKDTMSEVSELNHPTSGKYIYALAQSAGTRTYDIYGIDKEAVHAISHGTVSAVVSNCGRQKIRPERAHLIAHKEVLRQLMLESTVLPMAFGTVADNLKAVRRMLSKSEPTLREKLKYVEGKVEMGLRVVWDVPNIFEYFVGNHPDLRATRDQVLGGNRVPRQAEKIELGAMFDRVVNEDREAHYATIERVLAPVCVDLNRSPSPKLNEVVKLSCLVKRDRQKELEDAMFAAARLFDNNFIFDFNGPWAPHNFVELDLQLNTRKAIAIPC